METFEQSQLDTAFLLDLHNFGKDSVESLNLPEAQYADNGDKSAVRYITNGDPDAPNVLLTYSPYLTPIDADHMVIRLDSQQVALGEDWRVVGVEGFTPTKGAFSREDRRQISSGDFGPMAVRGLRVAEKERLHNAQTVLVGGYSLGGDLATQTVTDVVNSPTRGIFEIKGLSVAEAARTERRGFIAVLGAFNASGKDMFKNIADSESPALLDAWDIDLNDPKAEKKMWSGVNKGAMGYIAGSPAAASANWALTRGFAHDNTEHQVNFLVENTDIQVLASRHQDSKIWNEASFDRIAAANVGAQNLELLTLPGDHSSDDNVRTSAARVRHLAGLVAKNQ